MIPQKLKQRPEYFELNPESQLAKGLVFAGLGRISKTGKYFDSSLRGKHGVLTNMEPATDWLWDGTLNRWVNDFGGTNEYSALPCFPLTTANLPISLSYWVYLFDDASTQGFVHTSIDTAAIYCGVASYWSSTSGQTVRVGDGVGGNVANRRSAATGLITFEAAWHHVAHVITAVSDAGMMTWIDGVQQSLTYSGTASTLGHASQIGAIGQFKNVATNYYATAKITDVLLHVARALPVSAIQQLADPSNVMLSGLIKPPKRRLYSIPSPLVSASITRLKSYGLPGQKGIFAAKAASGLITIEGLISQDLTWNQSVTCLGIIEGTIVSDLSWDQALTASIIASGLVSQDVVWNNVVVGSIESIGTISSGLTWNNVVTGEIGTSGLASQDILWNDIVTGTVIVSGTVSSDLIWDDILLGKVDIAGTASQTLAWDQVGSGEIAGVSAGAVSSDLSWGIVGTGKVDIAGTISSNPIWDQALTGSIIVSGSVSQTFIWNQVGTSTVIVSGSISSTLSWDQVGSGTADITSGAIIETLTWNSVGIGTLEISGTISSDFTWNQEASEENIASGQISSDFGVIQTANAAIVATGSISSDVTRDIVTFGVIEATGTITSGLTWNQDLSTAFSTYANIYNIILYIERETDFNLYIDQERTITHEV